MRGGGGGGEYKVGGGVGNGGYFFDTLLLLSSFPSSQVPESLALPPTPTGGVRNKRKMVLLLPLFQLVLPCRDCICVNAPQLLIGMIYRILKSICVALNYGSLRIP